MRLTHFGHSCVLIELGGARILFDPGTFSTGFESLTGLDAILVTHQHPDHADPARLPALADANPDAILRTDAMTAAKLGGRWQRTEPAEEFDVKDVHVRARGGMHAVIHPDLPLIDNVGFLLGDAKHPAQFFHPGDALFVPDEQVRVLALPASAPWSKIWENVDYLRTVAPEAAVPIHHGILSPDGVGIFFSRYREMAPAGTQFVVPDHAVAIEI